jgi:L-alanine-DL-glutamate epimerase-like enolase superfamily enzyme
VLEREAADAVVVGSHESGGLWRWRQLATLAEAHGIPLNRHACVESEISTFAALQVLAAIPNLTVGNQVMHQLLDERLTTTPLEQDGGTLFVPDRPGLGFELDEDAVARARERHERQGPYLSVER